MGHASPRIEGTTIGSNEGMYALKYRVVDPYTMLKMHTTPIYVYNIYKNETLNTSHVPLVRTT